jgi:sugar transferase (PEP-CTERM/EpsH1 system associated)
MRDATTLILANRLPFPVDDGWKRRAFHVLRALSARGPVVLAVLHDGEAAQIDGLIAEVPGLEVVTVPPSRWMRWLCFPLGLLTREPFLAWRVQSRAMRALVRDLVARREVTLAIAELTHLHGYLALLPARCSRVIDTHNIDSVVMTRYAENGMRGLRRSYALLTAKKLRAQEQRVFAAADAVWVCSDKEASWVRREVPGANAITVPNGVDTNFFHAGGTAPIPNRLVFFGRLDYYPNTDAVLWFADQILPRIQTEVRDVELVVIGHGAAPLLHDLAARNSAIRLVGPVADLRPAVASAAVVLCPLRSGGGTRLKILEALALERPVVTTTVGMEGLDLEPGRDLFTADDPTDFAAAVTRLLRDPQLQQATGASGRRTVQQKYDWRHIERTMADLAHELPRRGIRRP